MPVKVGMNGFGRIGRYLLRLMADDKEIQIAAINARADNAALAYLFKYDSTYGTFQGTVDHDENAISPLPAARRANGNGNALA